MGCCWITCGWLNMIGVKAHDVAPPHWYFYQTNCVDSSFDSNKPLHVEDLRPSFLARILCYMALIKWVGVRVGWGTHLFWRGGISSMKSNQSDPQSSPSNSSLMSIGDPSPLGTFFCYLRRDPGSLFLTVREDWNDRNAIELCTCNILVFYGIKESFGGKPLVSTIIVCGWVLHGLWGNQY